MSECSARRTRGEGESNGEPRRNRTFNPQIKRLDPFEDIARHAATGRPLTSSPTTLPARHVESRRRFSHKAYHTRNYRVPSPLTTI